jgi:hypothetical protein
MADITINAAYGSVVEEDGFLFVGFAEGEDEDEAYVLFRQPLGGGAVWVEVSDESFGAEDAVQSVAGSPQGFTLTIRPDRIAAFGFAASVAVTIGPECEDAGPALAALRELLGPLWQDAG